MSRFAINVASIVLFIYLFLLFLPWLVN